MKAGSVWLGVFFVLGLAGPCLAQASWDLRFSGGSRGVDGFMISVGNCRAVPPLGGAAVHRRGLARNELPVAFLIARHAHVAPAAVFSLRLRGLSWMALTRYYGLDSSIFLMSDRCGSHRSYRDDFCGNHRDWRASGLRDAEIVNLVNRHCGDGCGVYVPAGRQPGTSGERRRAGR
jgi:hypothetical protein